jgi:hypothetical protein
VPVFISQGTADTTVYPSITRRYVSRLCRQGTLVQYSMYPRVSHAFIGRDSAYEAIVWMSARFAGQPAPSNCGDQQASP